MLHPYVLVAKNTRGRAASALIQDVLNNKYIYVVSELLHLPNIRELRESEHNATFNLLELFAYGTYQEYLEKRDVLPALTVAQQLKLRKLTLLSLADKTKMIEYRDLAKAMDIPETDIRGIEDLVIDAMYSGLLRGKLNQREAILSIDQAISRDVRIDASDIDAMIGALQEWCNHGEQVCNQIGYGLQMAKQVREKEAIRADELYEKISDVAQSFKKQKLSEISSSDRGTKAFMLGSFGSFSDSIHGAGRSTMPAAPHNPADDESKSGSSTESHTEQNMEVEPVQLFTRTPDQTNAKRRHAAPISPSDN